MAERAIREFDAKRILSKNWQTYFGKSFIYDFKSILVTHDTDFNKLALEYSWLKKIPLVVKPDMLFGNRGKLDLVYFKKETSGDVFLDDVIEWVKLKSKKSVSIKGTKGYLTHFLIEPFLKHSSQDESFIAFSMNEESDNVYMSAYGGIDIEEHWDKVVCVKIPIDASKEKVNTLIVNNIPNEISNKQKYAEFVTNAFQLFKDLHFTYFEINPLVIFENRIFPLDLVAKVDDTAMYLVGKKWGNIEFTQGFSKPLTKEEKYIKEIDKNSGASLKLTILNPNGRIWLLIAGGGASVVYADAIANLGYANELANYGEYSGNPSRYEIREYTKTILHLMTKENHDNSQKILLIGGAIANFTDVSKTFDGIIDAFTEYAEKLRQMGIKIYVRRGGPNYLQGLNKIKNAVFDLGLDIEVYGPEVFITDIVDKAILNKEIKREVENESRARVI